jgi:cobalt-zinc-cadmium efflux system outer membrane protein
VSPTLPHRPPRCRPCRSSSTAALLVCTAAYSCAGTPLPAERAARDDVAEVARRFRPGDARPELPTLAETSSLADFLTFAMLTSPDVEAAYYDWAAAVEGITQERALPDPRLTFEADIADSVMALMPGLMLELPGPGKLRAAGEAAAAESRAAYFGFERAVLRTALAVKTAYYRLYFLEERTRVERRTLELLEDLERLAEQQNAAGRVTLQDVLRAQIAREQLETELDNLADARAALLAEWKSALGLGPDDAPPPVPEDFEHSGDEIAPDELLARALDRNPDLRAMREDVLRAESALVLARKSRVPDVELGLEADLEADPTFVRPSASVTLPVWQDKIAAQIAGAQARKRAAEARLDAEQVRIAAELASMLYMYREAVRNAALLQEALLPRSRQSLEAARAGYVNGRAGFLDVIDAQRTLLEFELMSIEARTQRELALASLSLTVAGIAPGGAPTLPDGPHAAPQNEEESP